MCNYTQSVVTFIIGLVAASIAFLQWKLSRQRFKLDLFDKRYAVFQAVRKFLSVIFQDASFKDKDLFEFYAGTSDAAFLFNDDIPKYIDQIKEIALSMRTTSLKYDLLPVGEQRNKLVEEESKQLEWLIDQLTKSEEIFESYLGFGHIK